MSHATVAIKLSAQSILDLNVGLETLLETLMAPYDESPKDQNSPFLIFVDNEHEYRASWEIETINVWRDKVTGQVYRGEDDDVKKVVPSFDNLARADVPAKLVYPDFEKYCEEYHGESRDEQGRLGYAKNPNAKWDWYAVGGRWAGFYPIKPEATQRLGQKSWWNREQIIEADRGDLVRICEIDFDKVALEHEQRADEFYDSYQRLLAGATFGPFDGPRDRAMELGLIRIVREAYPNPHENEVVLPWADMVRPGDSRRDWNDVAIEISKPEFDTRFLSSFSPLITHAVLDEKGWHEPGRMGWFGVSHAETDANIDWRANYVERYIKSADPNDILILVDYHI